MACWDYHLPSVQIQDLAGIVTGLFGKIISILAPELGQGLQHLGQIDRAIALTLMSGAAHVRGIGLQYQRFQG